MPCFRPEELRAFGYRLFGAAGCGPEESRVVVDHLVEAALMGHDSHGIIRFYEYMRQIRAGTFTPGARPTVIREAPCVAQVDGNGAMGQVAGAFAAELAIEKARAHGVGVVSLRNCSHLGRIGAYPMLAAQVGMLGLAYVNAGRLGYQIAPFGGIDGKLSTNPISFAAPRRNADPILVDLTASVIAEGKLRVAINAGKPVPEGWIIDHAGRP
ncbi:MAG: Ldh family oxidoreductase, partial [Armatimonadetes bacterium]|nr:Ldh family oxidoreductase [Armatimonadota bacterium]